MTLLPPPVPEDYRPDQQLRLTLTIAGFHPEGRTETCSVRQGNFALLPGGNLRSGSADLLLPPLLEWMKLLSSAEDIQQAEQIRSSLRAFLLRIDRLAKAGCFPAALSESIRALILQAIPLQPQQALFNSYGYWGANATIDLRDALRLKVQRAYYRGDRFVGTTTFYITVESLRSGVSKLAAQDLSSEPVDMKVPLAADRRDLERVRAIKPTAIHRFLLLTDFVSESVQRAAIIISGSSSETVDRATGLLQSKPQISCLAVESQAGVVCSQFTGNVTVSPEVKIFVEGRSEYVPFGTTLWTLAADKGHKLPVRVRRLFGDKYCDIRLPGEADVARMLVLVGGDKISWAKR